MSQTAARYICYVQWHFAYIAATPIFAV